MTSDQGSSPAIEADRSSLVVGRSSEELVVLDSAGRLQLPGDQRVLAGIGRRARVELVDGGILIRPGEDDSIGLGAAAESSDGTMGDDLAYSSLYSAEPPSDTK